MVIYLVHIVMSSQQKLSREELLKQLGISDDTLSLYEQELGLDSSLGSTALEDFTDEDLKLLSVFHKLRESGLTYNEISILTSFSKILKDVNIEEIGGMDNLFNISPVYRLKQTLNIARQEIDDLRNRIKELEKELEGIMNARKSTSALEVELEAKEKIISNIDKKLSDAHVLKGRLETKLSMYKGGTVISPEIKGKKAKELYNAILEKEQELIEGKKKNEELLAELNAQKDESLELTERLELMEDSITEIEHELEERYQEQIDNLRTQIESLMERKQKEWDSYYIQSNDQHKKEILTLQKKHEQDILKLKLKIREQILELEEAKLSRNPIIGLLRLGEKLR